MMLDKAVAAVCETSGVNVIAIIVHGECGVMWFWIC